MNSREKQTPEPGQNAAGWESAALFTRERVGADNGKFNVSKIIDGLNVHRFPLRMESNGWGKQANHDDSQHWNQPVECSLHETATPSVD